MRCRRCFFFREPSSGEPPGREAEAFSESGGQNEAGHRVLGPVRSLWFRDLKEFLSLWLAPAPVDTLDPTRVEAKLFSPPPPEGGALTTVLLPLAAVFWKRRVWSACI